MEQSVSSNGSRLVVLEGLPGSGKTSHLKYLSQHSYKTIKEISLKIPKRIDEKFFLQNDLEKYRKVPSRGLVIMDRNYVSTLSYNFSRLLDGDFTFFRVLKWYLFSRSHGFIWQPYYYIYIRTPVAHSLKRKKRATAHKIWADPVKLRMMELFYNTFFLLIERRVKRIDGSTSLISQQREILSFLNEIKTPGFRVTGTPKSF